MDIILKFGEHYYESSDGGFWLTLFATLLGSGLAFFTALYFDRKVRKREVEKEEQKFKNELEDRLRYIKALVEQVLESYEAQNKNCKEFADKLRENPCEIQHLSFVPTNDVNRILALDAQSTFYAYRYFFQNEETWVKDYSEFNKAIDFIEGYFSEIQRMFFGYRDVTYKFLLDYKTIVDHIPDFISSQAMQMQNSLPEKYEEDPRYQFLNTMILKYTELTENGVSVVEYNEQFLEPLLTEIIGNYKNEYFSDSLMGMAKKGRVKLNDIKTDAIGTATTFDKIPNQLKKCVEILEKVRDKLAYYHE